ncbi:hypothetical protein [Egicoccus halophilus]|uniref:DUF1269 domain-containing protein n=1 Tax=Egicoccus halophilus TaxID=1670830 RepID=A0A8J3AC41_9ACTN|nr:hypothetical protein [Egicoccus halophilus]GGI08208.1 hypothetical protein GCM10011354_27940 [Egicoccus halophilus]
MGRESGVADLLAVHRNGKDARRTIERLSRNGIDGGSILLLGRVEVTTAGRYGDRQTDLGSSLALGGRAARGLLYGLLPGAAFGAVLLAVTTEPTLFAISAGAGGGAAFGASIGVLTGLLSMPTMASSWERTFAPMVPGGVGVGVRVHTSRQQVRVRRVLERAEVLRVHEVDDLDELDDGPLAFDD